MGRTKEKAPSAVKLAAQTLRAMSMAAEDGAFLGSEDELVAKLAISRPTLRQAVAQVAQEHLVSIRRGVGGGYFASSPNSMTVARMAAIYLQKDHARLDEVISAVAPIRSEIARLATRNIDDEARQALEEFLDKERSLSAGDVSYRTFLKSEREFARLLGAASKNSVLNLFLGILYDFAALLGTDEDVYINRPERVDLYRSYRNRMAEAILDGDEELAVIATRRCSTVVTKWMMEDFPARANLHIGELDTVRLGVVS